MLSAAVTLSLKNSPLYAFAGKGEVTGSVTADGVGIAGVVVSDGYSVVKTDNNGVYKFTSGRDSEFVFVSVPAGYFFPNNNGIARHYQKVSGECNFKLTKHERDDSNHHFLIWADPQVKNVKDVQQMMSQSVPDVQKLVKSMGNSLIHGIGVGDLVWDNHDLFESYTSAVGEMGIPFFQTLGNHDEDYGLGGDETSDQTFKKHYGPTYYSFNRGKAHYVVLDNVRYLGKGREYDGYITEEQLSWLEKDLSYIPKENLLIICTHIPVYNQVKNNRDLYKLLNGRNVHIMSGHTHNNTNNISDNVYEHVHGTVCGAWWTGPICEDGAPRGYGVYTVKGNDLEWYYKSTGLHKDYQISIEVETLTNQKRALANVWNWDPAWKVEWFADGKPMGVMENTKAYDPQAVRLYKGDDLPIEGRHFAEPKLNQHMFMAHMSPDVKEIRVRATDRFNNVYESTVSA